MAARRRTRVKHARPCSGEHTQCQGHHTPPGGLYRRSSVRVLIPLWWVELEGHILSMYCGCVMVRLRTSFRTCIFPLDSPRRPSVCAVVSVTLRHATRQRSALIRAPSWRDATDEPSKSKMPSRFSMTAAGAGISTSATATLRRIDSVFERGRMISCTQVAFWADAIVIHSGRTARRFGRRSDRDRSSGDALASSAGWCGGRLPRAIPERRLAHRCPNLF